MNYAIIGTGGIGGYYGSRPIRLAREVGFAMPRLEMLEAELRFLES